MALQSTSSEIPVATNVKNTIAIYPNTANSTVYTVPANRYFEGFVLGEGSTTMRMEINGSTMVMKFNSTNPQPMPLFLKAGDVLTTIGSDYQWTLTGVERELG